MQDHNVKQLGRISMYAKCIGGCMQGAIVRVRIPGYVLKKRNFLKTGGCMQGAIVRIRIPGYVLKKRIFLKNL